MAAGKAYPMAPWPPENNIRCPFLTANDCPTHIMCWPTSLAWSDLGKHGEEAKTIAGLVQAEVDRLSERGEDMGERMRDKVVHLGKPTGIDPTGPLIL